MSSSPRVISFACPRCHAPLSPSRFARQIVCPFCEATVRIDTTSVEVKRYREALKDWDGSRAGALRIAGKPWILDGLVARGEGSDVYRARSVRWPAELALAKIARDPASAGRLEREAALLRGLSDDPLAARVPQVVQHGAISEGPHAGSACMVFRDEPDFRHPFASVRGVHHSGVDPRAAIWMWRRILEVLAVLHGRDLAHGAILPPHLLVEDGEHGVRVVGFGCAGRSSERVTGLDSRFAAFADGVDRRSFEQDLRMTARCIAYVLGGDPVSAEVPSRVPAALAERVHAAARGAESNAWAVREELGRLGRALFGPPSFCPIDLP